MNGLFKIWSRKEIIVLLRTFGEIFLGAGIITAAFNKSFGSWTPVYWFILSIAFLVLVVCSELSRIIMELEKKREI